MKTIATLLLSACTFVAFAQNKTKQSLHQDIDDNGKQLTVNINGTLNGKSIQYHKQFDVSGMSQKAREAIVDHIVDSLGVTRTAHTPVPPAVPASSVSTSVTSAVHKIVQEHEDTMSVKITGTINNTPINYNRSFRVKGLSKQQKDNIVRHVTDSLGIGGATSN